jgi:hypothetical protein
LLTQRQGRYENNPIIPSKTMKYLVQSNHYQIPNLSQESPEAGTETLIPDPARDSNRKI